MTTQSTAAQRYRVFVEVPHYFTYLFSGRGNVTFVNKGLRPGQLEGYNMYGSKAAFVLAAVFSSTLTWLFSATFIAAALVPAIANGDAVGIAVGGTAAVLLVTFGTWATMRMDRLGAVAANAIVELKEQDVLASVPENERFEDLRRISRAIQYLQREHGSNYDDQAREAVIAVLDQNRSQPDEKHLTIARSDASDATSAAIRKRALEAEAAWGRDVATAEKLILELEEAAGIRAGQPS